MSCKSEINFCGGSKAQKGRNDDVATQQDDCQVRLTSFGVLPAPEESCDGRFVVQIDGQPQENKQTDNNWARKFSAPSFQCEQKEAAPPTENEFDGQVGNLPAPTQTSFRVVWTQLKYEVEVKSYDKLIGSSIRRLFTWPATRQQQQSATSSAAAIENGSSTAYLDSSNESINKQRDTFSATSRRTIFENLNGYLSSGELTAILGPSGAGKTSLLNAIGGRTENYRGTIDLVVEGEEKATKTKRMRMSVIPQKDYLLENLTVRENLKFSSKLLNSEENFDHESNILRVVKMLNLTNCLNSLASKISGGEYKRVSIAQELLKQPDILILDEPTSGLDSLTCKKLVKSLVQLIEASKLGAINPIAIVMTIHQPDVDVFRMFDHVYCMARDGQVVFDGKPSEALEIIKTHTSSVLNDELLESSCNPANLLIELASGDVFGQEPIEQLARVQRKQFEAQLCSLFGSPSPSAADAKKTSTQTVDRLNLSEKLSGRPPQLARDRRLTPKTDSNSGKFWYHTRLLSKRAFYSTLRDPLMAVISLLFHLTVPCVMWLVYPSQIGRTHACPIIQRDLDLVSLTSEKSQRKIEALQNELTTTFECSTMFFLTCYALSMCSLGVAALTFPLDMHVLLKEVRNGWYSLPSYVIGKMLANFPFEVLFPVGSLILIYVLLEMPPSEWQWRVCGIAATMALVAIMAHTQGLIVGSLCMDSVQTSIFLSIAFTLPQVVLSGYTARIKFMPIVLRKLSWLSPYKYASELIQLFRFGFGICPCDESTNEYLRTNKPDFSDVPENLKPMLAYYLSVNSAPATGEGETVGMGTTTLAPLLNATVAAAAKQVPGVAYDLLLEQDERAALLKKLDSNEVDAFGRLADLMSRSFSFGRQIDSCDSVRSQVLVTGDIAPDNQLGLLLGCMCSLAIALKLILFLCVRFKIGSRV